MTRFSRSEMRRLRRSGPAMTRSIASSSCGRPIELEVVARREQRRLVHEVGEVGAGEAGRAAGDDVEVDAGRERLLLAVHREDRLAALEVGPVDDDLAVEATGAQQRGVEDVGAVGRREQDHALRLVEAVHLDEQLVERLLALVVPTAEARRRGDDRRRRSRRRTRSRAPPPSPARTGRARVTRRRRRTSRRSRSR